MKFNKWTVALAAIGVVSLGSAARADEAAPKMNAVQTALSSTTLSGYVDTAATWRPGTDNGNIPAYSYAKNDGFSLNAVDIALDHPEDESPWAAGYHVELMLGPDSPITGFFNSFSGIRQAYVTLRMPVGNGIDWKIGTFDPIIGYESNSDPLNPNYTRSYGYTTEPVSHTGVLASYKVNDMLSLSAGIANTWSEAFFINTTPTYESQKAYMGAITFTAPDSAGFMKGATMTVGAVDAAGNATSFYAGATLPTPVSALNLGLAFDYYDAHNSGAPGNTQNDSVWVIGAYGSFQATDKLSFNLRAEYLSDNGAGPYGSAAEEFTATAQYKLWMNVISRVEFRWDHVEHGTPFGMDSAGNSFRGNDFLLALNVIYQF